MKVDLDTCSTCDNFRRLWEIASHEHVKIPMFGFEKVRRMDNMIMFQQDTFLLLVLHSNQYLYYFTIFGLGFLFRLGHRKRSVLYFVVTYLWVLLRSGHVYAGNAILGTPVALVQRSHKKPIHVEYLKTSLDTMCAVVCDTVGSFPERCNADVLNERCTVQGLVWPRAVVFVVH